MMQDILTTLATAIEIAALAYFGLSFVHYVNQQNQSAPRENQPLEVVSSKIEVVVAGSLEVAEIAVEEPIHFNEPQKGVLTDVVSSTSEKLGVRKLRLLARDRGITGFARMNKAELLTFLA